MISCPVLPYRSEIVHSSARRLRPVQGDLDIAVRHGQHVADLAAGRHTCGRRWCHRPRGSPGGGVLADVCSACRDWSCARRVADQVHSKRQRQGAPRRQLPECAPTTAAPSQRLETSQVGRRVPQALVTVKISDGLFGRPVPSGLLPSWPSSAIDATTSRKALSIRPKIVKFHFL